MIDDDDSPDDLEEEDSDDEPTGEILDTDTGFDDPDDEDDDEVAPPKPTPPPKRSSLKGTNAVGGVPRAKLDDPKVAAEVWQKLTDRVKNTSPLPYSVREVFKPDDIIEHKGFGVGFVIAVPGGNKLEVLFADQVRKLVMGR